MSKNPVMLSVLTLPYTFEALSTVGHCLLKKLLHLSSLTLHSPGFPTHLSNHSLKISFASFSTILLNLGVLRTIPGLPSLIYKPFLSGLIHISCSSPCVPYLSELYHCILSYTSQMPGYLPRCLLFYIQ